MTRRDPAAPADEALVRRLQEQVRVAKAIQSIPDLELLDNADTAPELLSLRTRLSHRRQVDQLRRRHRARLRAQRRAEWDAAMDDRGHRLVRRRALADSPARRAASLERLQHGVVGVGAAGIIGMGAASTAGVHAGLVALVGPSVATAAWGYEPAVIALVAGGIVARSVLTRAGGRMPAAVTVLEWVALTTSIVLSVVGSGWGAALFPAGTAVLALVMQQLLGAIATADVHAVRPAQQQPGWSWRDLTTPAPAPAGEEEHQDHDAVEAESARRLAAAVEEEVHRGLAEAEDYLRTARPRPQEPEEGEDAPAGGGGLALADPPGDDDTPAGEDTVLPRGDDDTTSGSAPHQPRGDDAPPALERAARRRAGDAAQQVAAYYADHPGAPVKRAARDLGVDPKTVRKYRPGGGR
ncbi:hypothetical protein HNR12_005650 [Streptomonospora nanhaiensis]|uniref:Uncharacterized protein n=1 Tax=Streptomonospora nanhaiensis TaxID=1323731 RepID=A0A853BWV6_9ACTN|nr:hypothetical protein [Streptomonospora nanhaiensis]NYI99296.1 hypothetical protein [Streptomonospora nanhaiensis]